eukprot:s3536_g5.t1
MLFFILTLTSMDATSILHRQVLRILPSTFATSGNCSLPFQTRTGQMPFAKGVAIVSHVPRRPCQQTRRARLPLEGSREAVRTGEWQRSLWWAHTMPYPIRLKAAKKFGVQKLKMTISLSHLERTKNHAMNDQAYQSTVLQTRLEQFCHSQNDTDRSCKVTAKGSAVQLVVFSKNTPVVSRPFRRFSHN